MHSLHRAATASWRSRTSSASSPRSLVPAPEPTTAPASSTTMNIVRSSMVPRPLLLLRCRRCRRQRQRQQPAAAATAALASSTSAALASTTFSYATVAAVCAYAALVTRPRSRLATFLTTSPLLPLAGCLSYLVAACVFWPGAVSEAAARAISSSLSFFSSSSSSSSSSSWFFSLKLPDTNLFAALFASSPGATAMTWLHLLAGDFAAAAWVVRDARRLGGESNRRDSSLFAWTDDDDDDDEEEESDEENEREEKKKNKKEKKNSIFKRPKHFPCAASVVLCFMAGPIGIVSHLLMRRLWYALGWAKEAKREVIDDDDDDGGGGGGRGAAVALSTF